MPVARYQGTEADIKKYIAKLKAGSDKYDREATINSINQIKKRQEKAKQLREKLIKKKEAEAK